MARIPFSTLFPAANPDALHLLNQLLAFDPSRRVTVEDALEHRYLSVWHDASDEPICEQQFDFAFEVVEDVAQMKGMILEEVCFWHCFFLRFCSESTHAIRKPSSNLELTNYQ